jgi:hypothetical protein
MEAVFPSRLAISLACSCLRLAHPEIGGDVILVIPDAPAAVLMFSEEAFPHIAGDGVLAYASESGYLGSGILAPWKLFAASVS